MKGSDNNPLWAVTLGSFLSLSSVVLLQWTVLIEKASCFLGSVLDFGRWSDLESESQKSWAKELPEGDFCNLLCSFLLSPITLQALIQCGQPQCYTHILQWLRSEKANPLLIDAVTYLMALMPEPSAERLQEIFSTAKEQQSRATLYALSHTVNK